MDKYEEALEKARELHGTVAAGRDFLAEIFPELRESEDDRIRNDIMEAVENWLPYERVEEIRAYLRKQKVQKFTEKQDYSDLTDLERAIHRGFLVVGVENVPVTIIKETAQDCLAWMKPAWSEDIIRKAVKEIGLTQHQIDWFKTNVFPPKQEWSEELDTDTLREWSIRYAPDIRQAIESTAYHFYNIRPHWKPSEEQMNALYNVINPCDYVDKKALESLYEQLKKL